MALSTELAAVLAFPVDFAPVGAVILAVSDVFDATEGAFNVDFAENPAETFLDERSTVVVALFFALEVAAGSFATLSGFFCPFAFSASVAGAPRAMQKAKAERPRSAARNAIDVGMTAPGSDAVDASQGGSRAG